jgi:CheY-like chemotaxis protein
LARKILLADDSVTAQNMGRKILADAGYEVIAVNNGSAALKKIAELKPDLVILDVYMPGYSGLEVCQRLKESPETARIPVLLTVGKLEPFKPEEAQRVRAEGFIVKPFEASELLSTLSKLEDKVVPRSEPSKPGRFARAIAAAEEAGRGGRSETASDDSGWKSRIGFPKQKAEAEEKSDEAPARETEKKEDSRPPVGDAAQTNIDIAALAPPGLPKDVTPEEVAAIAAAAAQIQMAGAIKDEQISEARPSETTGEASRRPLPDKLVADVPPPPVEETHATAPADNRKESKSVAGEAAPAETYHRRKGDTRPEETQDIPVTMAATAESVVAASAGGSRWTAVSVALEAEEATVALDQEMQKAHGVSQDEKSSAAPTTVPDVVSASPKDSPKPEEAPVATISKPEPEPVPEPRPALSAAEPEPVPAPQSEPAVTSSVAANLVASEPASLPEPAAASSKQPEITVPEPVTAEVTPIEAPAESSPAAELAQPKPDPVAEAKPAMAESAAASSNAFALQVRNAEPAVEPKADSEAVKSTAAAWATWRQVRDTGKSDMAETQPKESNSIEPAPAENARAAAAGAEQILQEASAAAASGDSGNVASIVDSVLADLRPKLMEEISRKMSEKK